MSLHAVIYRYADDPARLDVGRIHGWLAGSYWSPGIARGLVFAFVVVLIGGLAGVSREAWWTQALFSPPMESAVIAAKPWLPVEVADKIRFR